MINTDYKTLNSMRIKRNAVSGYIIPLLLTLLSAVLLPLALPNELFKDGLPLLSFICLSPFFIAVIKAPTFRFTSCLGMIFGIITTYITYYWLQFFGNYTVYTIGGAMFVFFCYFALLAPFLKGVSGIYILKPAVCSNKTAFSSEFRPIILAIAWTYYEFLKSSGFLGFPWALISHPVHDFLPFIQFVDITGIWGLSFLMAFINAMVTEIILDPPEIRIKKINVEKIFNKPWANQGLFTLFLVILVLVYGTIRLLIPMQAEKEVRVILVQQNRDPWARGNYELSVLQAEALTMAGYAWAGENKPDVVIWSETSFQTPFSRERITYNLEHFPEKKPFVPFVKQLDCYFLVGAPHDSEGEGYNPMNSVVLLSPEAEIVQYYGKQHPVPFVESIPFWEIPVVREFYRKVIGIHGVWALGNKPTVFELPVKNGEIVTFSTPICFEDVFPDLCRKFILAGSEMLINLTNVSWSKTDSAEIQMYIAAKFRAIENRRVLVRSTNSGVTCVVDSKGRVLEKLPLFTPDHILTDVPVMKEDSFTFYTMFGDFLPLIFGFLILGLCILHAVRNIREKRKIKNA